MRLTIIFDNTVSKPNLIKDWGFACLIEHGKRRLLFDTGADGEILLHNMKTLGIDPQDLDDIFISHNHFDHIGGLSTILNKNSNVSIYLPQSLRGVRKAKEIIYIDSARKLTEGLYTTGELDGIEQSLIVQTTKGLVIIVGCSHPDMDKILKSSSQFGNIYGIIGGLHGFNNFKLFKNLQLICPTHCTQHKMEIKSLYPMQYVEGGVGNVITVP